MYLGVDVGNSKTLSVVVNRQGEIMGTGRAGGGNFQSSGRTRAGENIGLSIGRALAEAGLEKDDVMYSFLGMAGADREQDFAIVRDLLEGIVPGQSFSFDNDAVLGLLAERGEKRGICVVCGSGTNVIGFDGKGNRVQIGGLGFLFGDYAGGPFITKLAIRRAVRGWEGRGPETVLYERLCESFGVERLIDLLDMLYEGKTPDYGARTELVFAAAREGDWVARGIIEDVAGDMVISAGAALDRLDADGGLPVIALGGAFQKAEPPVLYNVFSKKMREVCPGCSVSLLAEEPVLGAALGALLEAGEEITIKVKENLHQSWGMKVKGM